MTDQDHDQFRREIAELRSHQEVSEKVNSDAHAEIRTDVKEVLRRLDERSGAEKIVFGTAKWLAALGLGSLGTWLLSHVSITAPDALHAAPSVVGK